MNFTVSLAYMQGRFFLKRNMLSKTPRDIAMFTIIRYEDIKEYNNRQLGKRYKSLNLTLKMLLVVVILLVALSIVSNFAVKAGLGGIIHGYSRRSKTYDR